MRQFGLFIKIVEVLFLVLATSIMQITKIMDILTLDRLMHIVYN